VKAELELQERLREPSLNRRGGFVKHGAPFIPRIGMTNTMTFFALAMIAGCSSHKPLPLPEGNMPMTEQEYQESELLLLKRQKLPPEEYQRRRNEILVR
jgi:hypothetical protein